MRRALIGLILSSTLAGGPAGAGDFLTASRRAADTGAPTLQELEAREADLDAFWLKLPLTQRHALFVSRKADLYGNFAPRDSSVFAPGEPLLAYVEPVGYAWTPLDDGRYQFGLTLDFQLKTAGGKVLGEQKAFQNTRFTSRFKNRELFVNLTLTLNGLEPGRYVIVYTLHDDGSDKVSRFELPFTIKG